MPDFDFDVAISFLADDEGIAIRLADVLRERGMKVFVYSEQQKELALKDGIEEFTSIFRERSRVCVVLYRQGWGETKWTRIEENAIKDRAFEGDWDSVAIVALAPSKGRGVPSWVPKPYVYMDFDRYGLEATAAVIDHKVRQAGAEPRQETARERSDRLLRLAEAEQSREVFLSSKYGVEAAQSELKSLFALLESETEAMSNATPKRSIQFERSPHEFRSAVRTPRAGTLIGWENAYGNTVRKASLLVREFARPVFLDGYYPGGRKSAVGKEDFTFTQILDGRLGWISDKDDARVWSTEQLADRILSRLIDRTHEARNKGLSDDEDDDEEE